MSTTRYCYQGIFTCFTGVGVRIVGGENCLEGRIEVYLDAEWGTVCSNGFGDMEAHILCKTLRFR